MQKSARVTVCVELLNSRIDHPAYQGDHTAFGVAVMKGVNSPRVKLLYDIYHMQIMEGDVIRTIRDNIQWIGHFHTGGVPGRHEIDASQELNYHAIATAIADLGYTGYVAHEFMPTRAGSVYFAGRCVPDLLRMTTYRNQIMPFIEPTAVDGTDI